MIFIWRADARGHLVLAREAAESGLRPAVSYLFRSLADSCGANAIGVLLTGMGRDGAAELKRMKDHGAYTIAQDRDSSIVHGMPGAGDRAGRGEPGLGRRQDRRRPHRANRRRGRVRTEKSSHEMRTITPSPPLEILIAEDSATQAQRLQHILEQQGYRVTRHGKRTARAGSRTAQQTRAHHQRRGHAGDERLRAVRTDQGTIAHLSRCSGHSRHDSVGSRRTSFADSSAGRTISYSSLTRPTSCCAASSSCW